MIFYYVCAVTLVSIASADLSDNPLLPPLADQYLPPDNSIDIITTNTNTVQRIQTNVLPPTYVNVQKKCPNDTVGEFPNCRGGPYLIQVNSTRCPVGQFGVPPLCHQSCGPNEIGIYPVCEPIHCPPGSNGTYPHCSFRLCEPPLIGIYPNCHPVEPYIGCPAGQLGHPPNCYYPCPAYHFGIPPNCERVRCPAGWEGEFQPNCTYRPQCPPDRPGEWPYCVATYCPKDYLGKYPDCVKVPKCDGPAELCNPTPAPPTTPRSTTTPATQPPTTPRSTTTPVTQPPTTPRSTTTPVTQPPTTPRSTTTPATTPTPYCPSGHVGVYPNCSIPKCPVGYTGTPPDCKPFQADLYLPAKEDNFIIL